MLWDDDYELDRKILLENGESPEALAALDREVYGDIGDLEREVARTSPSFTLKALAPPAPIPAPRPKPTQPVSTRIKPAQPTSPPVKKKPPQSEQPWVARRRAYLAGKGLPYDC